MSKESGKVQAKSWQPPAVQAASKGFSARPFPEIAKKEAGLQASLDRSGTKDIKPGVGIENINRAIASASPPVPSPTVLPGGVQAKLTLGAPGDKYEQEADRVARQVVDEIHSTAFRANNTRSEGESQPHGGEAGRVQRKITVRAAGDAGGKISSEWEGQLQSAKSGGQPLTPTVREPMERAFGADFGGVRVHTGAQADRLARSIQAKAFTTGQDVFFRQGAYEPGNPGGQELLAHELTHVMQRKVKEIQRMKDGTIVKNETYTVKEISEDLKETKEFQPEDYGKTWQCNDICAKINEMQPWKYKIVTSEGRNVLVKGGKIGGRGRVGNTRGDKSYWRFDYHVFLYDIEENRYYDPTFDRYMNSEEVDIANDVFEKEIKKDVYVEYFWFPYYQVFGTPGRDGEVEEFCIYELLNDLLRDVEDEDTLVGQFWKE